MAPTPEEQFSNVCQKMFEKLFDKMDGIDKKLFHDNGTESLQSRTNFFSQWIVNHDKTETKNASFWYWLIPLTVSVGIIILNKIWKG